MAASAQDISDVIDTYRQATEANHRAAARRGNVIVLTPDVADDVMVTADLHGHRSNFNAILKIADLDNHPRRHLILQEVCHGGPCYPTGGCMSHQLLEDVARLKVRYPERVHFLMSNHELAELMDFPILKGRRVLNLVFRCGLQEQYGSSAEEVRQAYLPFLQSCPVAVRVSPGIFICHSVPDHVDLRGFDTTIFDRQLQPADLQEHSDLFELVWGRDYRPENASAFARLVGADVLVNGHEPCPEGFRVPNERQIILDCCSQRASYLILPTGKPLNHAQIVSLIQYLPQDA